MINLGPGLDADRLKREREELMALLKKISEDIKALRAEVNTLAKTSQKTKVEA